MTDAYAYTSDIWLPVAAAIFVAVLGLSTWRRRDVPGGKPFVAAALFASLWLLGIALEAAAVAPGTKIAWYKFQFAMQVLAITAGTCFTLEYSYPGRWLTRRNLALFAVPPLLTLILIMGGAQFVWLRLGVGVDGAVVATYATLGMIVVAYAWCLGLINAAAFVWLFVHSPPHRWPVAVMLFGQVAGRALFLVDMALLPAQSRIDLTVVAILAPWMAYAIALFGFHMLDPLPAARATALEQMREGMVVLDADGRVVSLNPSGATILNTSAAQAKGMALGEVLPALSELAAGLEMAPPRRQASPVRSDRVQGPRSAGTRWRFSQLRNYRGVIVGHLLMFHDVTEQRRARVQILEQARALATLRERERLARELHDGVAQTLAAAQMQVKTAKLLLARGERAQLDACLDGLNDTTLQAQADVREYLLEVKTAIAGNRALFPTLREYLVRFTQEYGLAVELTVPLDLEEQRPRPDVELQVLCIVQEALTNVRKHVYALQPAGARPPCSAAVIFARAGMEARIAIVDDGPGFDPAAVATQSGGYGLCAMRERAEAVGGSLAVMSDAGYGTQVVVMVPWTDGYEDAEAGRMT